MRFLGTALHALVLASLSAAELDVRISKGLGSHGYNAVRISAVDVPDTEQDFFTYNAPFQHRWTEHSLHSVLKTDLQIGDNEFVIGDQTITVNLPKQGQGVRGLMFGDPCSDSTWVSCHSAFHTHERLPAVVNAASSRLDFWGVVGDNWYDENSTLTKAFFAQLNQETKSTFMWTVPGNHDFWVRGSPFLEHPKDQYGNGFMQWYGQDTVRSAQDAVNFRDFSIDPDDERWGTKLANVSNFVWYHQLGNIGFIGVSGAHQLAETDPYIKQACASFLPGVTDLPPDWIYLAGHWPLDDVVTGGQLGMGAEALWKKAKDYPGCDTGRLRFLDGHIHCNKIQKDGMGFMIGGTGMKNSGECGRNKEEEWGVLYIDTTTQEAVTRRQLVVHFTVANTTVDHFDDLTTCFEEQGIQNCLHLGNVWLNVTS